MAALGQVKGCPCCKCIAIVVREGSPQPQQHPFAVKCMNIRCGIATPWLSLESTALSIWNNRRRYPK